MVALFEVVERLAGAGLHPARAVQHMRHLMDAGIIRRGPRGRPSSSAGSTTQSPNWRTSFSAWPRSCRSTAPQKARRLAGYISLSPALSSMSCSRCPIRTRHCATWLIAVLHRLAELPRDQRKSLYLADPAPTLTFRDELTSPYPYADDARFEWGKQYHRLPPARRSAA